MDKKVAWQIQYYDRFFESLKIASSAGFKYIAIGFGSSKDAFLCDDWRERIEKIRSALKENNIKCVMTHAPYYDLRISAEITDDDMETALLRCVEATSMLGAEICAVHPRAYFENGDGKEIVEKSFECNKDNFEPLVRAAEKYGCMLGIENLPIFPGWDKSFYSCFPEEHKRLVDCYRSSAVCAVWDFGHAHLTGMRAFDKNPKELLRELGTRIKGTHVHNNYTGRDDHLPPGLGEIKWEEVLSELYETGFDGYLTLEITDHNPNFELPAYVKYLYDSVCRLYDIMEETGNGQN